MNLFEKKFFADVIKLRTLRCDHLGLSVWALNSMVSDLIRDIEVKCKEIEEKAM